MSSFDVIVVGGGASGMMAAGRAASRGKRVLLIEKNRELGKKLSITGGGRCNITNAEYDVHKLLAHYTKSAQFLFSPFSQFGVQDTFAFFEALGLPLTVEAHKRAFPHTESAKDVTAALVSFLKKNNVTIHTGERVVRFTKKAGIVTGVVTSTGTYTAESYVLATGGRSHTETGSTGDGILWVRALGHRVYEPSPDLVPLMVREPWIKRLSGRTLTDVRITLASHGDTLTKTGKILCTHFGMSGPVIMNMAGDVKKLLKHGAVSGYIDLYPTLDVGAVRNKVQVIFENTKNKLFKNVLTECVPNGISHGLMLLLPEPLLQKKVHSVTKEERNSFADMLKTLPVTVTGTMGYDWAVVSDGGVDLAEIDTKTMRSKRVTNLFITGDMLHIRRPSGGYSLQLCWTTGWVAGSNV